MRIALSWLRVDARLRWRSLAALALLVALATAAVLAATAGARRGGSATHRLLARTLPSDATVLPNQPGFDWSRIRALPEVAAVAEFAVTDYGVEGIPPDAQVNGFPVVGDDIMRTMERPVILRGRLFNPSRSDEAVVTARFVEKYHKSVGDTVTARLFTPAQVDVAFTSGVNQRPTGPRAPLHIVGIIRSPWFSDGVGTSGGVQPGPGFTVRYRANLLGTRNQIYVNALVRLRHGEADLPPFTRDLARVTGRHDIDVWNNADLARHARKVTGFESDVLFALAGAAAAAAAVLIGQTLSRYTAAAVADLQVLRSLGMTPRQAVLSATLGPGLAGLAGAALGLAGASAASPLFPIGAAERYEPAPGFDVDALVLGGGGAAVVVLCVGAAAGTAWLALASARRASASPRTSTVARLAARLGLPVPVQVGARFALEVGGPAPVRPAIAGAVVGVLGVLAALTFRSGVVETAADRNRFGQTFQASVFLGINGQPFAPAGTVTAALAADKDVVAVNDTRSGVVDLGDTPVTSFTYQPVGRGLRTVVLSGRMPRTADEIALAPESLHASHLSVGETTVAQGGALPAKRSARSGSGSGPSGPAGTATRRLRVVGVAFVPEESHNDYASGAWLTAAGFDRVFPDGNYKFRTAYIALRPGVDPTTAAARLSREAGRAAGTEVDVGAATPLATAAEIREVRTLPMALGAFLAVLAVGAVGHALASAVRRRRGDLAVLRALGMTRRQSRAVVAVQASLLGVVGIVVGVPAGVVVGRTLWRVVADRMPVLYVPPLAALAVAIAAPVVLAVANLLAAVFGRRAAQLRVAATLRAE